MIETSLPGQRDFPTPGLAREVHADLLSGVSVAQDIYERIQPDVEEVQGQIDVVLGQSVDDAIVVIRPRDVTDVMQK